MEEIKDYRCITCGLLNTEFDKKDNNGYCYCGGELLEDKKFNCN